MTIAKRVAVLEQTMMPQAARWHCLTRYEGETEEQVVAAYEAKNGPIGSDNRIMQVIISKPGERPDAGEPFPK